MCKKSVFVIDFLYSFSGVLFLNCVLQFLVYPYISNIIGESEFGILITLLSIINLMSTTFGSSANYARVISHSENKDCNGDYNIFLFFSSIIIVLISIITLIVLNRIYFFESISYILLMILTNVRIYADVNFRFDKKYKYYFFYNLCISIGYILGLVVFSKLKNYYVIFFIGEIIPLFFVRKKGIIFNKPFFSKGKYFKENTKNIWILVIANFIESLMNNIDKFIILIFIGEKQVTFFYLATLLGKSMALLTVPLNSVIIGHIVNLKNGLNRKNLWNIFIITNILVILFECMAYIVSNIFIKIFYPNFYNNVKNYIIIGNLGQIINFITCMILVILLKFIPKKYQIYINVIQLLLYFCIVIPSSLYFGINGIIWAILVVNLIKLILTFIIGFFKLKSGKIVEDCKL